MRDRDAELRAIYGGPGPTACDENEFFGTDPAFGTNGGFPDDTWDGEREGPAEQEMEEAAAAEYGYGPRCDEAGNLLEPFDDDICDGPCVADGRCIGCGGPIERTYVVTATIQLCINAQDGVGAAIAMKDHLNDLIAESDYSQDPLNGAIIDTVDDITVE